MSPVNFHGYGSSQLTFGAGKQPQQTVQEDTAAQPLHPLAIKAHKLRAKYLLSQGGEKHRDSFNRSKAILDENNVTISQARKKLSDKNWHGFNLKNIIFDNANLTNVDASNSGMDGVSLVSTRANNCNFDHASIKDADAKGFTASTSTFENASIGGDWTRSSLPDSIRDGIKITIQPDTKMNAVCYSHPSWNIIREQMKNPETPTMVLALAALREKAKQEAVLKGKGKASTDLRTISEEDLPLENHLPANASDSSASNTSTSTVTPSNSNASLPDLTPDTSLESSISSLKPTTPRNTDSIFFLDMPKVHAAPKHGKSIPKVVFAE